MINLTKPNYFSKFFIYFLFKTSIKRDREIKTGEREREGEGEVVRS